ncbi:MAG: dihydroorotase [Actinomycetia bacterium]|nr:dihydroorotase [Actinomycetes bacterium]MCP5034636.1 dihydroorotase [Actinomycetes bacterium]
MATDPAAPDPSVTLDIAAPDDWHVHLRDDHMLATVAPITAGAFRYALVMPNLVPPITTTAEAAAYRARILAAVDGHARPDFQPIMALYMTDRLTVDDLRAGVDDEVVYAVKYYPAGATTNSADGGTSLASFRPVLEAMAESRIPLLVHAESTDPTIDIYDRERAFLDQELAPLMTDLATLPVTVEHISTQAGVELVLAYANVKGSITPHHLSCDRSDLLANGLRPDLYCKPIINSADDRAALVAAATSGSTDFFLGTDSAPHPSSDKYAPTVKPGIFNAPFALPVVAEVFHQADALGALEGFTSVNGCRHYGFKVSDASVRLSRHEPSRADRGPEVPSEVVTSDGATVRIFGVAEANRWTVEAIDD